MNSVIFFLPSSPISRVRLSGTVTVKLKNKNFRALVFLEVQNFWNLWKSRYCDLLTGTSFCDLEILFFSRSCFSLEAKKRIAGWEYSNLFLSIFEINQTQRLQITSKRLKKLANGSKRNIKCLLWKNLSLEKVKQVTILPITFLSLLNF